MLLGIYHVTFQSSLVTVGECITVCDPCGVHGANESYVFRGQQVGEGEALRLTIEILHLCGEKYRSFGDQDSINVDLEVTEHRPEGFRALGGIREARGIRLHVVGRKLGELAV